jgi:hypothetical protein
MSASISSVSASPTLISAKGGISTITPVVSDQTTTAKVTVSVDGSAAEVDVVVQQEAIVYSVDPADLGKPGVVVATVDQNGTLSIAPDGVSFIFTAA